VGADPGRLRIAWSTRPPLDVPVDPECARAARETAELLASLGHEVEEADLGLDGEILDEPMGRLWAIANVASYRQVRAFLGREPERDELEITTWELVEWGSRFDAVDLLDTLEEVSAAVRRAAPFFERYAAWVTPTLAQPPLPLGVLNASYGSGPDWWRIDLRFNPWNPVANVMGHPAISLPLGVSSTGLPLGTLLTGRYADEATLLRLAAQLERARPWHDRRPPAPTSAQDRRPPAPAT
jgi:Asp-tRNA(Asn)/Glu-tRNA(Gln) amidotransferase A subunit family amidase